MLSSLFVLLAIAPKVGTTIEVEVNGVHRTALVYAPNTIGRGKVTVVFGYHGHGGNSRFAANHFLWQDNWPEALVIYPQGVPTKSWVDPQGLKSGWEVRPGEDNVDVQFFNKLLAKALGEMNGDPNHVYVMGHSNGGYFA